MMSMKKTWCCPAFRPIAPTAAVAQSAEGGAQKRQNLPLDTLLPVIKL
jgi:hypothetical protein